MGSRSSSSPSTPCPPPRDSGSVPAQGARWESFRPKRSWASSWAMPSNSIVTAPKDQVERRKALAELEREITSCRSCPRLVEWREKVAREKRAAYADEEYWGRPVPGFGDAGARVVVLRLGRRLAPPRGPSETQVLPRRRTRSRFHYLPRLLPPLPAEHLYRRPYRAHVRCCAPAGEGASGKGMSRSLSGRIASGRITISVPVTILGG